MFDIKHGPTRLIENVKVLARARDIGPYISNISKQ